MANGKLRNMELDDEEMMNVTGGGAAEAAAEAAAKAARARAEAEANKLVTCPYCRAKVKNKDLSAHKDKCVLEQAKKAAQATFQTELAKQNALLAELQAEIEKLKQGSEVTE